MVLSNESGFVCITLYSPAYWPKLYVESMYSSTYADLYSSGWTWVDEPPGGTNITTLSYKSDFGNSFVMASDGNVGVGTGTPTQKLEVNGNLLVGSSNYNNSNSPIIRLGHQSADLANGSQRGVIQFDSIQDVSVNTGDAWKWKIATVARAGNVGNYNSQFEILRTTRNGITDNTDFCISRSGNVGIGTTNSTSGLYVTKSGTLFFQDSVWMQPGGNTLITARGSAEQENWIGIGGHYYATSGSANILLQANFGDLGSHAGHYISSTATGVGDSYFSIGRILASGGLAAQANKQPQLSISSSGNVGIGTVNATTKFQVVGGTATVGDVLIGTTHIDIMKMWRTADIQGYKNSYGDGGSISYTWDNGTVIVDTSEGSHNWDIGKVRLPTGIYQLYLQYRPSPTPHGWYVYGTDSNAHIVRLISDAEYTAFSTFLSVSGQLDKDAGYSYTFKSGTYEVSSETTYRINMGTDPYTTGGYKCFIEACYLIKIG